MSVRGLDETALVGSLVATVAVLDAEAVGAAAVAVADKFVGVASAGLLQAGSVPRTMASAMKLSDDVSVRTICARCALH